MAANTDVVVSANKYQPKAVVITGFGINCDQETALAFERSGARPDVIHLNDLIARPETLLEADVLAIPGGFSFGDDVASGKILANRLRYSMGLAIKEFVQQQKPVIGICNGFQVMAKMGLLPWIQKDFHQDFTLTHNTSNRYEDRWVYLKPEPASPCIWLKNILLFEAPVRHGEGRFVPRDAKLLERLELGHMVALRYATRNGDSAGGTFPLNPNGSQNDVAGVCDPTGRIFGLMPHPEAYQFRHNHPRWTREFLPEEGAGLQIFKNAVAYCEAAAAEAARPPGAASA